MENIFLSNKVFASITIFLILLISGCNNTQANRDFSSDFINKIDSIENFVPVSEDNTDFTILGMYLHEMSGHFPTSEDKNVNFRIADEKDSIIYSRSNFENDKKVWLRWLRKNKSKYTLEYSDSVYNWFYEKIKALPPRVIYDH
jgi:hypothetical protein